MTQGVDDTMETAGGPGRTRTCTQTVMSGQESQQTEQNQAVGCNPVASNSRSVPADLWPACGPEWQDIETAPKDGTPFDALYDDGAIEADVYWAAERYCMIGAPNGSKGPGCMSSEVGLPVSPTHWRLPPLPRTALPHPGDTP